MFGQRGRLNARLIGLAVVFALAGVALTARIVYVQLVHAGHYQNEARDEHFGQQVVRAPRGAILDRNGFPLATTVDAYDVFINRPDWQDSGAALRGAAAIAPVIDRDIGDLLEGERGVVDQPDGGRLGHQQRIGHIKNPSRSPAFPRGRWF